VVGNVSVPLVLGLDIGGSWTRALLSDTDGLRLGSGRSPGANPVSHGVETAAARISVALIAALSEAGAAPAEVAACVVGMAGASRLAEPAAAKAFTELWELTGLRCPVSVVSDVTTAFAAGTDAPNGSVLIAGTGAIAASIVERRPAVLYGGHGWLLGDEGSGYWIGRQAVRAALADLETDGLHPGSAVQRPLTDAVLDAFALPASPPAPGTRPAAAVIAAVSDRPPVDLARLAPTVSAALEQGDRAASGILHDAADHLVALLARQRAQGDPAAPIVLAGGVLEPPSFVHRLVLDAVSRAWPKAAISFGHDTAAGAARLAAYSLTCADW
jgi:glucosamine kinase